MNILTRDSIGFNLKRKYRGQTAECVLETKLAKKQGETRRCGQILTIIWCAHRPTLDSRAFNSVFHLGGLETKNG